MNRCLTIACLALIPVRMFSQQGLMLTQDHANPALRC